LGNQINKSKIGRTYSKHGELRNPHKILVSIPSGKKPLGRPRHRREDIKMDPKKWGVCVWTGLNWLRKGFCEHGNEYLGSIIGTEFLTS
jgi:hypothetical protein